MRDLRGAITEQDLLDFHDDILASDEGLPGVPDPGAVDAAVNRPWIGFGENDFFPTIFDKAAALMESVAAIRHPFVDGNKRTGLTAGTHLLFLAGYRIKAQREDLVDTTLKVACHRMSTRELARWLEEHSELRDPTTYAEVLVFYLHRCGWGYNALREEDFWRDPETGEWKDDREAFVIQRDRELAQRA